MLLFGKQDVVFVHRPAQEVSGVQSAVEMSDLVMKMRCGARSGIARIPQQVAALHELAGPDLDPVEVAVERREAEIVNHANHFAQSAVVLLGCPFDHPVGGGMNRRAHGRAQVGAAVHGHALGDGMAAHAETAGDPLGVHRPPGRNGLQHQALFKCGLAGGVDPLNQRPVGFGA